MDASRERPVCEVCGKEAIGVQSLGCCATTVCAEHAEPALREAKPGETIGWDCCAFHRFEDPPESGGGR